jgi:hypothetical protein
MSTFKTERRKAQRSFVENFNNLHKKQALGVKELKAEGYKLLFVRSISSKEKLAVLQNENGLVTIDIDGVIDKMSNLVLRK